MTIRNLRFSSKFHARLLANALAYEQAHGNQLVEVFDTCFLWVGE